MTVKEMKNIINDLPDDTEIEVNSVCGGEEYTLSPISEAHYCNIRNKVCITPVIISV